MHRFRHHPLIGTVVETVVELLDAVPDDEAHRLAHQVNGPDGVIFRIGDVERIVAEGHAVWIVELGRLAMAVLKTSTTAAEAPYDRAGQSI